MPSVLPGQNKKKSPSSQLLLRKYDHVSSHTNDFPTTYVPGIDGSSWVASFNRRITANLNLYTQLSLHCRQLGTLSFAIHWYNGLHHHGWCVFSFQALDIRQCCIRCHRQWAAPRAKQVSLRRLNCMRRFEGKTLGGNWDKAVSTDLLSKYFPHCPSATPTNSNPAPHSHKIYRPLDK